MIVTVFTPMYDGAFDAEYGPYIYEGRLSRERVLEIGQELGSGYARAVICGDYEGGWYVSFCNFAKNDEGDCPPPVQADPHNPAFGERYDETVPGCGKLAYDVTYAEVRRP